MKTKREWLRSLVQIGTIAAIGLTTRASFADHYFVPSGSMEPTVHTGDHIFVNKAAYGLRLPFTKQWVTTFKTPVRGDVVILEADGPDVLLKRVAAVGGDVVEVREGHVQIDGHRVDESMFANDSAGDGGPDFGPVRVPDGKLLVLGDNRGNSRDGRTFGWIDRTQVLGRATAVIGRDHRVIYRAL
jgi:signal peptidase I